MHSLPLGNLTLEKARAKLELRAISRQTSAPNSLRHPGKTAGMERPSMVHLSPLHALADPSLALYISIPTKLKGSKRLKLNRSSFWATQQLWVKEIIDKNVESEIGHFFPLKV